MKHFRTKQRFAMLFAKVKDIVEVNFQDKLGLQYSKNVS